MKYNVLSHDIRIFLVNDHSQKCSSHILYYPLVSAEGAFILVYKHDIHHTIFWGDIFKNLLKKLNILIFNDFP